MNRMAEWRLYNKAVKNRIEPKISHGEGIRFETIIASALLDGWVLQKVVLKTRNGTFILYGKGGAE